ncbi:MAG TPA: MXAN_6640 family putative metalloprotease [Bacteroidota bacterium]|nr:MXAN_6640 family putative metalloprotease [Bacteroidota bacterium]
MRTWLIIVCAAGLWSAASGQTATHADDVKRLIEAYRPFNGPRTAVRRPEGKCGLQQSVRLLNLWPSLTPAERRELKSVFFSQQAQADTVIGRFHFYYDTTGSNAPMLLDDNYNPIPGTYRRFVDSAGAIFNHVWHVEIDQLGYDPPPLGPDSTYPIDILSLDQGLYGETVPDPIQIPGSGSPPRYRTFIEIDNTFQYVYSSSRGLPGLHVTAAHEFHHAIQFGAYGFWGSANQFYMEITSTWMETVVYPSVHDYYQYVSDPDPSLLTQFTHPETRFTALNGSIEYSRAVWGKFIEKRFSRSVMRRSWELMRQQSTLAAVDAALTERGSSFREAFLEYAFWNLNTGPRSDTGRYYSDGLNYAPVAVNSALYFPPSASAASQTEAFGSVYYSFCLLASPSDSSGCGAGAAQMPVIVTNLNTGNAYLDIMLPFTYGLSRDPVDGADHLANNLYAKLYVPDPGNWNARTAVPVVVTEPLVFPNPYRISSTSPVWFRLPVTPVQPTAHLRIFSSSYHQVYDGDLPVVNFQPLEPSLRWNGIVNSGALLSSGIYIYSLTVDNTTYTGKFAAIRQ